MLTEEQRIEVATRYENAFFLTAKDAVRKAEDLNESTRKIAKFHSEVRSVTLERRRKRLRDPTPIGEAQTFLDEKIDAIHEIIILEMEGSRLIKLRWPRRFRKDLLEEIAKEASVKYGKKVTPRLVERCLEEFRRHFPRKQTRSET